MATQNKKPFIEKVGKFLAPSLVTIGRLAGAASVAGKGQKQLEEQKKVLTEKAIAQYRAGERTPERRERLLGSISPTRNILMESVGEELAKTDLQIVGDAVITGLTLSTVAFPFLPKGGPSTAPLTGAITKALPVLGKTGGALAARYIATAPTAATYFGARGMQAGKPISELPKEAARGLAWNAIVVPISYGTEKTTQVLGKWLYSGLTKYASNRPGATEVLFTKKLIGTANHIKDVLQRDITPLQSQLKNQLSANKNIITRKELINKAVAIRTEVEKRAGREVSFNPEVYKSQLQKSLGEISEYKLEGTSSVLEATRTGINSKLSARDYQKRFAELPDVKQDLLNYRTAIQQAIVERVPSVAPFYDKLFPLEGTSNAMSIMSYKVGNVMAVNPLEVMALAGTIPYPQAAPAIISGLVGRRVYMTGLPQTLVGAGLGRLSQFIAATQTNPIMQKLLWATISEALKPE